MRPEFGCGLHDYVFDTDRRGHARPDRLDIRDALDRWEPRIEVHGGRLRRSPTSIDGALLIDITYALRATNDVRNLVYPFYVIPAEEVE